MLNEVTKQRIAALLDEYRALLVEYPTAAAEVAYAELAEAVYNSNAIENSTLTLEDTEDVLQGIARKGYDLREVFEAKNLAEVTQRLIDNQEPLSKELILSLHGQLLRGINDDWAGRFRRRGELVRVGNHMGANPQFIDELIDELLNDYHSSDLYFVEKIAWFHAEFEVIHPFSDGNGRIGRVLINQQLMAEGAPPIIIPNKGKQTHYYPVFRGYPASGDYSSLSTLIARQLMESLHKRIAILSARRIIRLADWARSQGIAGSAAVNRAQRGTLPGFRMRGTWMISADATP